MTKQRTIWESITLVRAFNSLHNNFEMTIVPIFHFGNKDLKEIQQIITSTKAKNLTKQAVGVTADLALIAKNK